LLVRVMFSIIAKSLRSTICVLPNLVIIPAWRLDAFYMRLKNFKIIINNVDCRCIIFKWYFTLFHLNSCIYIKVIWTPLSSWLGLPQFHWSCHERVLSIKRALNSFMNPGWDSYTQSLWSSSVFFSVSSVGSSIDIN